MSSDFYLYLPETAIAKCAVLVAGHKVVIHVVRDRKTKHGDFRVQPKKPVLITINAMENPYRFYSLFCTNGHTIRCLVPLHLKKNHMERNGSQHSNKW